MSSATLLEQAHAAAAEVLAQMSPTPPAEWLPKLRDGLAMAWLAGRREALGDVVRLIDGYEAAAK